MNKVLYYVIVFKDKKQKRYLFENQKKQLETYRDLRCRGFEVYTAYRQLKGEEQVLLNRKYVNGIKKMVAFRMPEKLIKKLSQVSKKKGWTKTDLMVTVLDLYIQSEEKNDASSEKQM